MLKRLLIPGLILAVAIPLMAQKPLGRGARRTLNLTPDQVNQLKSIQQANKPQRQAIAQDVQQKRQALNSLRAQSNPNPTELGNAMLALKQARQHGQQLRQQALAGFKSSLTPDQQKTLEQLQARRKRQ